MLKLLTTFTLSAFLCAPALAGPKEEALQVLHKWTTAFTESDVDAITKLYAADALFMGTGSKTLVTKPGEIRAYFEQALLNNRPRGALLGDHSVVVLSDAAVLVTGMDTVTGVRDGQTFSNSGRVTFVVAPRADGWRIVHFHRSAMPR
jgi:uncharacterized protein (TIGR02246 family)